MKKLSILYLIGLLLLAGCNNQVEPGSVDTPASGDTPLAVSAVSLSGSLATKTTTAQNGGSIGVFRTTANGYTALNNVQYTYASGWSTASPIYLNTAAASVCAYFPYGAASITTSTAPTAVTLTSKVYSAAEDLCYSTLVNTATAASPGVTFNMNHAYARLTINITHAATYAGTCAISNVSIANAGIKTSNTLNMTTGAYGTGTAGTVSYNPGIASIASGGSTSTQVLMVPVTTAMTGNLDLSFTVDGIVKTASLAVATNSLSTLAAGGNYNINIQIGTNGTPLPTGSNCYILNPSTTAAKSFTLPVSRVNEYWGTSGLGNTPTNVLGASDKWVVSVVWQDVSGLVTLTTASGTGPNALATVSVPANASGNAVVGIKRSSDGVTGIGNYLWSWHLWVTSYVPNTTTVNYNGKVWMDRNLGAKTNGTSATAYGLFYQWGRKDPFPTTDTTFGDNPFVKTGGPVSCVTAVNNPYRFYYNGSSPYDWSSPQNNNYWNSATNTKTVYDPCPLGYRVPLNTYFNGVFTDNTYAGYRYGGDGALSYVGSNGYWWSCIPSGASAFNLYFNGNVYSLSRAYGFSVRCVKE